MKTALLLSALLCWSAHADFTADIYKTPSDNCEDPRPRVFAGNGNVLSSYFTIINATFDGAPTFNIVGIYLTVNGSCVTRQRSST